MKRSFLLLFVLLAPTIHADDQADVLKSVRTLIDAWREANVQKADAVLHPDFRLVSFHHQEKDAKVGMNSKAELLKVMKNIKPGEWDDRLEDPKVTISKTGIANVWTEYQFYVDGKLSHCGIESFQIYGLNGVWQIINFADTHGPCP